MLASLPWLLIGALFVMYVILGILYGSYIHPITVLLPAVVPAVVGGLATLWVFDAPLSLYSIIGLFLLLGMVKKNGLIHDKATLLRCALILVFVRPLVVGRLPRLIWVVAIHGLKGL